MVAANRDPTNASYTFSVRFAQNCTGVEADRYVIDGLSNPKQSLRKAKHFERLAVTDSAPQDGDMLREMKICPLFFAANATRFNLQSKIYQGEMIGSWCRPEYRFKDFETAGHTLLHEMTHLDALAKAAGVPKR